MGDVYLAMDEFEEFLKFELAMGKIDQPKFEKIAARVAKKHGLNFYWDDKYKEIVFIPTEEE